MRRPAHGYHSACSGIPVQQAPIANGKKHRYTDSVIFDGEQAYPAYVIYYTTD
jgi:hypothetical protein